MTEEPDRRDWKQGVYAWTETGSIPPEQEEPVTDAETKKWLDSLMNAIDLREYLYEVMQRRMIATEFPGLRLFFSDDPMVRARVTLRLLRIQLEGPSYRHSSLVDYSMRLLPSPSDVKKRKASSSAT